MNAARFTRWLLVGAVPVALTCVGVAQTPQPIPKARIERPVKEVVANTAPASTPATAPRPTTKPTETPVDQGDRRVAEALLKQFITPKGRIERPAKAVVANAAPVPTPAPAPAATADNPTVEPGKVKWHATLEDAQAAAKKSGKPVLLFQMMGYLDKKFC